MRRPTAKQSVLRTPLNSVFATEGNVRVLRELLLHGGEMGAPLIAKRVGISRQHVLSILASLKEMGVVERVGLTGHPTYRANPRHPLHLDLERIFQAEHQRFEAVKDAVRDAAPHQPKATAIWLYGSVARGSDTAGSDVDVAVILENGDVEQRLTGMYERLAPREESLHVRYSLVGLDHADVLRLSNGDPWWESVAADAVSLVGPDPERLVAHLRRAHSRPTVA